MKKISVDGGALVNNQSQRFGNYVFTQELVKALKHFDNKNQYILYLQERQNIKSPLTPRIIRPNLGWLKLRISIEELFRPNQIFLAINQALPWYLPGKKIVFCHGLAPLIHPKLYPDSNERMKQQIRQMLKLANYIVVGSEKLKNSLNDINGEERGSGKIQVLNYGIPASFLKPFAKINKQPYLLYVGSNHPIKNLDFLITAFKQFIKMPTYRDFKLKLIGVGTNFLVPKELSNQVAVIDHVPHHKLGKIYRAASCLITTSLYESFNLPALEALSQQTQVVGLKEALIPELKPYCFISPNNPEKFAQKIVQAIEKPKQINLIKLKKQFNWQLYVNKLLRLYE